MISESLLRGRVYRGLELSLWLISSFTLGIVALAYAAAVHARHEAAMIAPSQSRSYAKDVGVLVASSSVKPHESTVRLATEDTVLGMVEIPALSLSVPITAGVGSGSLLRGVGHVDGTAYPGGLGTVGLAGHRDTYLRPLERVATGMDIRLIDQRGVFHYRVDSWEIVTPERVEVLNVRMRPELVLITCYPFHYIGAAPKRFVVHAHLVSVIPE